MLFSLHCLSAGGDLPDENEFAATDGYNTSYEVIVEEIDRLQDDENIDGNVAAGKMSPKTPLKLNNTIAPLITFSEIKSTRKMSHDDDDGTDIKQGLELSYSTVTSYTPQSTANNRTITATPQSCYSTPTVDNDDDSKLTSSFCRTLPPNATPSAVERENTSVHLIDLLTPDVFHTPKETTTVGSVAVQSRGLLKSAIKNSAQKVNAATPKRILGNATKTNILKVIGSNDIEADVAADVATVEPIASSVGSSRSNTPRRIYITKETPTKALFASPAHVSVTPSAERRAILIDTPKRGTCIYNKLCLYLVSFD